MATRRTTIEVEVLNLQNLQQLNRDLGAQDRRLQQLTTTYQAFNAAVAAGTPGLNRLGNQIINVTNNNQNMSRTFNNVTNNIQNMGNAANRAGGQFGGMLGTMLKYRAVSAVFEGVQKSIGGAVQMMMDLEKQTARVQRVSAPGSSRGITLNIAEEQARTGVDVKEIGEAYYQLNTQLGNTAKSFAALQTAMNIVVGTEADARDVARAMLQIYNQFGDELGKNVDDTEKLRRAGELLTVMWKGSAAEISEITAALKYLGPAALAAHVPLEQVAGLISALTFEGVRGRMGGTEARALVAQIIKNINLESGFLENKGAKVKLAFTTEGGVDFVQLLKNINQVASELPAEQALKFKLAIAGTMQAWNLVGTMNPDVMRVLGEKVDGAAKSIHGLSDENKNLAKTMMTTEQEGKRAWGGLMSYIALEIDRSPLRSWLHGVADDLQHMIEAMRGVQSANVTWSNILGGLGGGGNDTNAQRRQLLGQQGLLRDMLRTAKESNATGTETLYNTGQMSGAVGGFYNELLPAERGYLQRFMSFQRNGLVSRTATIDFAGMQAELARINAQLTQSMQSTMLPSVTPYDPFSQGANILHLPTFAAKPKKGSTGGYDPEKDDEAQKAAEEARQKLYESKKSDLAHAQMDLEIAEKQHPTVNGIVSDFVQRATRDVDKLKMELAVLDPDKKDSATLLKGYRHGIDTAQSKLDEEVKKQKEELDKEKKEANKEWLKESAAYAEYYAELARDKYGVFSPITRQFVDAAQKAAIAAQEPGIDLTKLLDKKTGPAKEQYDLERDSAKQRDEAAEEKRKEAAQASQDQFESARTANENLRQHYSQFAQDLAAPMEDRIRARALGLRPNMLAGGADARQEAMLTANVADMQHTLDLFKKYLPDTSEEIADMKRRLADANAALTDFHDTLDQKAYAKRAQADQDAYQLRDLEINHLHKLKFYKDQDQADADMVRKLSELAASAQANMETVSKANAGVGTPEADAARREARKRVDEAEQNLSDFKIEARLQRYQDAYNTAKTTVHGALSDFLHGQGDAGTVLQRVGGSIVDASIDSFIKKWADPLVQTITSEILAIQDLTNTMSILNTTMTGGGGGSPASMASAGLGAVVAAGVGAGIADAAESGAIAGGAAGADDGGRKGVAGSGRGPSDLQRGLGAGLAAYSIGANAAQQGVNVGNLLGGIASGASIGATFGGAGSLIGGAIGGLVDIVGGFFHHNNTPTATPQDLNPAYYNAPSAFDVAAYNYSAYGKLPRVQDVGFEVNPMNVPTIIVNVDGARVAAQIEINRQATIATVSLNSPMIDRHLPT